MKIETAFEVGSDVYYIKDKMVIGEAVIEKIIVQAENAFGATIEYVLRQKGHAHTERMNQADLWRSKQDVKDYIKFQIDKL